MLNFFLFEILKTKNEAKIKMIRKTSFLFLKFLIHSHFPADLNKDFFVKIFRYDLFFIQNNRKDSGIRFYFFVIHSIQWNYFCNYDISIDIKKISFGFNNS
jgi:hypothetical protein